MPLYRRKPTPPIEAARYVEGQPPPDGVYFTTLDNGRRIAHVTTTRGEEVAVRPGEWVVTEPGGGRYYPIAAAEFARLYEPA